MKKLFMVVGVIFALLVGTNIQVFAEENIIYGCMGPVGQLRIVDDPNECKKSETAISWNRYDSAILEALQNQIDALQSQIDNLFSGWRFVDLGDGTVRDNSTGLIWLKNANCFGSLNWNDAMMAAEDLADDQCGLTDGSVAGDWRLPTKSEWEAFVDTTYSYPALCNASGTRRWSEGDAFDNVQPGWHWSSTPCAADAAWYVYMDSGYLGCNNIISSFSVWPVRDE